MEVLKITPEGAFYEEMDNTLEAFQQAVGGYIEVVPLTLNLAVVCNEEGKNLGLPVSAFLLDGQMQPYDAMCCTLLVCRSNLDTGEFESIQPGDRNIMQLHLQEVCRF